MSAKTNATVATVALVAATALASKLYTKKLERDGIRNIEKAADRIATMSQLDFDALFVKMF